MRQFENAPHNSGVININNKASKKRKMCWSSKNILIDLHKINNLKKKIREEMF